MSVSGQYGKWPECCKPDAFSVQNIFSVDEPPEIFADLCYWLAPDKTQAEFVLDLGCKKIVNLVELVNTHNGDHRDRGTKEFKVWVSRNKAGPWHQVVRDILQNPLHEPDPLSWPVRKFLFKPRPDVRFAKFKLISWYGRWGGGLQFFNVEYGEGIII